MISESMKDLLFELLYINQFIIKYIYNNNNLLFCYTYEE